MKNQIACAALSLAVIFSALPLPAQPSASIPPDGIMRISPIDEGDPPLKPKNCKVHVARRGEWRVALQYNCGEWFTPPVGYYTAWLEAENAISQLIAFSYGGGGRPAPSEVSLVPAGRVRVRMERQLTPDETVRLIALDGGPRPFGRRASPAEASAGVLMPAGRVIAGVFRGDEAVALSRPITITAGNTTSVTVEPPRQGSVLALLQHPPLAEKLELLLENDGRRLAPEVRVDATTLTYGIWYEVEPRPVRVRVGGSDLVSQSFEISLQAGNVKTLRQTIAAPGSTGKNEKEENNR